MSIEQDVLRPSGCRSLGEYVEELVRELEGADPAASERLRRVVGNRRARIRLDDETIEIELGRKGLEVGPLSERTIDGEGATDGTTVLDILNGYLEVADAILDGRLLVTGSVDAVARMFLAIELLLDASARAPALQRLARDFRRDLYPSPRGQPVRATRTTAWYPAGSPSAELALIGRLDLLPDSEPGPGA